MTETLGSEWLVCPRPQPAARARLVCCHHAGGTASTFRSWSARLPDWIELWAVQLPGRESRVKEPLVEDLHEITARLAPSVVDHLADRPLALFGHSMGALVAYELARRLSAHNRSWPDWLFVSGRNAPHRPRVTDSMHLADDETLVGRLREIGGTPELVLQDPGFREMLLPIYRADLAVCNTYEHHLGEPLRCPMTILGGADDTEASPDGLAAWSELTTGVTEQITFPGGHFFISTSSSEVLELIEKRLSER
jgi:surfactin synthase thioesterase subunit